MNKPDLPNITRRRKSFAIWASPILGAAAALLVLFLTPPPGPSLDPDAASYLGAAESLVRGRGYRVPIADWRTPDSTSTLSHFPPGYSTAIAVPTALGMRSVQAARVVNAIAAFIDIALVVWLVGRIAGSIAGVTVAAALLVMPALAEIHLSVLSEPLYLAATTCALASMVSIARRARERERTRWIWIAGLVAAAAVLIRYAGMSVVAAVVLWTMAQRGTRAERLRGGAAAALPSVVLFGAWTAYVHLTSGARAIRTLGVYPGILETLRTGIATVVAWLVPLESDDVLPGRSLIALTLLAFVAWIVRRGLRAARRSPDERSTVDGSLLVLTAAAGVLASSYVLILLVSRLLADPAIPFDERLLSPLFLLAAILLAGMATAALRDGSKALRVLGALVFLSWWVAALRAVDDEVQYTLENGRDLTQSQWRESPLLGWARANAAHRPVYSNWASAVVLHLGRTAHELPPVDDAAILTAFTDTLRVRDGVALAFDWPGPRQIGVESLRKAAGLHIVARLADGSVFAAAP